MAIHPPNTSGTLGPVIFYIRNGKQCSRTRPVKVNQTRATKKSSSNFSIASKLSAAIRKSMATICKVTDGSRHARLSGAFSAWLKSGDINTKSSAPIALLKTFKINPGTSNPAKWNEHIQVYRQQNDLEIKISELIPSSMMRLPKETAIIRLKIVSVNVSIRNNRASTAQNRFDIAYDATFPATTIIQSFTVSPGSILLTGIAVECLDDQLNQVKWRKGYNAPAWFQFAEWIGY